MKVSGKKTAVDTGSYVKKAGGDAKPKKSEGSTQSQTGDNVVLSPRAREINSIKKMLESVPEVRGEMVVKLKADIESGNYQVDAGKVAEKMIERALRDVLHTSKK